MAATCTLLSFACVILAVQPCVITGCEVGRSEGLLLRLSSVCFREQESDDDHAI